MFGSQVLETAIGLVLMFFVVAFAASSIVEVYSRLLGKRAKDLEGTVKAMLAGSKPATSTSATRALDAFKGTSIYQALQAAAGKSFLRKRDKLPSYISAKAFADAVTEMLGTDGMIENLPAGLEKRLRPLVREAGSDLLRIKAGLERWFDDTMGRLEGAYKRWATMWLLLVGFIIAVVANASTFDVAEKLWRDPVTRQAVAETAGRVSQQTTQDDIESVAQATDRLEELGLPVGWDAAAKKEWGDWARSWEWSVSQVGTGVGWIVTALLVMLGAPFWFDVLTKLASLRSAGTKPRAATGDDSSATTLLALDSTAAMDLRGPAVAADRFKEDLAAALGLSESRSDAVPETATDTAPASPAETAASTSAEERHQSSRGKLSRLWRSLRRTGSSA